METNLQRGIFTVWVCEYAWFSWGLPTLCAMQQSSHEWNSETRKAEGISDEMSSQKCLPEYHISSTKGKQSAGCEVWKNWTCITTGGCYWSFVWSVTSNSKNTKATYSCWRVDFTMLNHNGGAISLSNNTICRGINDLAADILEQLISGVLSSSYPNFQCSLMKG